jgi:hypothetical protein
MASKNFSANLKIGAMMGSSVGRVFGGLKSKLKEQETTLKGLRAAYKEAAKGTGEYAGRLDELRTKTAAAERELKRLRAAANFDVGKGLKNVGSIFGADLRRAGMVGGVVGAAGLGIAKNMLDITATFEKALTVLKTVEGSGEKAQKSFTWIQDFAQRTPFELQQVLDSFVKLKAYGIDPIRGDTLRILGDTASAMGKDVNDAVEAMADAVTGENERLKEFGIKAAKEGEKITYEYTDRAGKTVSKMVDAANREQIKSTLLAIFNSKYKGAMDDQSKTWNGMISNMKDSWARFAYMVMSSGPFEALKNQLQGFLDKLAVWAEDGTMKKWAEKTGQWMLETGKKIGEVVTGLWKALDAAQNFLGGWDNLGIALVALNFLPTIAAVGKLSAALWVLTGATWAAVAPLALVGVAIAGIGLFIASVIDPGGPLDLLGKLFPETMEKIRVSIQAVGEYIEDKIDAAIGKLQELLNWFGKLTGIGDFFSGTAGPSAAPNYDIPRAPASILGVMPKGERSPLTLPQPDAPPATKEDLLEFIKPQASNSTYNINVNAPGSNGDDIADRIRRAFERKPLFDSDGALVPG